MKQDNIIVIHPDDQSRQTVEIMQRFNDVFQRHDPSALPELIAENCVIENTVPAPDGARHVGREACVRLWSAIADEPGTRFDVAHDPENRFRFSEGSCAKSKCYSVLCASRGRAAL